jgi:glycerophosphoryl diester phosphodiesterase
VQQGADFLEPDLVVSRDGVLVVRHENEISGTTDVADHAAFADRHATKCIDGQTVEGWFTEDFTLAELKTLRCRERLPDLRPANTAFDGRDEILTFAEVIAIARTAGVGVFPETKHPTYFASLGLPLEPRLVEALRAEGWDKPGSPVMVQSFEPGSLKTLRPDLGLILVQLIAASGAPFDGAASYAEMITPDGLEKVANWADAIGPDKALILPRDAEGRSLAPTTLVADAHTAGLKVFPWTFRAENNFLPTELRRGDDPAAHGDLELELQVFRDLGVDGVFSDFPAMAVTISRPTLR